MSWVATQLGVMIDRHNGLLVKIERPGRDECASLRFHR